MSTESFKQIEWLNEYMDGADHIDVASCEGGMALREFVAAVLSYKPAWMQVLWRVRLWLLRSLGQGESSVPEDVRFTGASLPIDPGEFAGFFKVMSSDGESHWVAACEESHLGAAIAVKAIPTGRGSQVFQVLTVVRYNNWAGPIYFNVIKPFHYLVIKAAIKHAVGGLR